MSGVRLKAFLIISSILHIVALFILAVIFQPEGIITKPQLIQVGMIGKYKDPEVGNSNSVESPPKEILKPENKETTKLGKKVVKPVIEKKREIETSKKKEIANQD